MAKLIEKITTAKKNKTKQRKCIRVNCINLFSTIREREKENK